MIASVMTDFGPVGMLVAYLYLRDRRMAAAILTLAEEQPDVDEEQIHDKLTVPIPDKIRGGK